jgi:Family of unknown function (DUF5832)
MSSTNKIPEWLVNDFPALTGHMARAAVNGQVEIFPQVVRSMSDPPIAQQKVGNVSFMLFNEPKKLKSGKPVYGFIKLRGNWSDDNLAKKEASKIICEHDSKYKIRIAPVGEWVPLTEDESVVKEQFDIKTTDSPQVQLRDQAVKEKEEENAKIMKELRDKEEELKKDLYDDQTSLDFYTMKRVTDLRLNENLDIYYKKIEEIKGKIIDTRKITKTLEKDHPEYTSQWLDNYNRELRKAGVPDHIPNVKLMKEYENLNM